MWETTVHKCGVVKISLAFSGMCVLGLQWYMSSLLPSVTAIWHFTLTKATESIHGSIRIITTVNSIESVETLILKNYIRWFIKLD